MNEENPVRRWWIVTVVLGLAAIGWGAWISFGILGDYDASNLPTESGFADPVLALEFVASEADVDELLGSDPERAERLEALRSVQDADRWFPLLYGGALLAFGFASWKAAPLRWGERDDGKLHPFAGGRTLQLALCAALLAVLSDYAENRFLAEILAAADGYGEALPFGPLAVAARLKFAMLGAYGGLVAGSVALFGRLGRFVAMLGRASLLLMAAGVIWPPQVLFAAMALFTAFTAGAVAVSLREALR